MKKLLLILIVGCMFSVQSNAQNWLTSGNAGLTSSNFFGTTDSKPVIFKINNAERGRLQNNGTWRFGTTTKNTTIDSNGNIKTTSLTGAGYRTLYADSAGNITTNTPALTGAWKITNDANLSIPDNSCTGAISTITFSNLPTSVQSSSITATLTIHHNNLKDLKIFLIAPNHDILNLAQDSLKNDWLVPYMINTIFNDGGIALKQGNPPYSGIYKPEGTLTNPVCTNGNVTSFGAIGGGSVNPNGVWTLWVFDKEVQNTGILDSWTLSVNPNFGINDVWNLRGNIGTDSSNFMGTIDNHPLLFRINNSNNGFLGKNESVAFGKMALNNNTAIGLVAIGDSTLYYNTTGSYNTAIGYHAGYKYSHSSNNTYMGSNADASADNLTNAAAIGYNALVGYSNMMMFGNALVKDWGFGNATPAPGYALAVGTSSKNGNGAKLTDGGVWTNASDQNLKEDFQIQNAQQILDKVKSLSITRWKYKGTENEYHIGPTAQDFYKAFIVGIDDKSISTIDPSGIALLAIQALSKQNDELKNEIAEMKTMMHQFQQNFNNCNPCGQQLTNSNQQEISLPASLEQNIPNPFNNTTAINYALPKTYSSAKIIIINTSGKILKEISLSGSGKGSITINASTLSQSVYNYSLYMNGNLIDTKQMLIAKQY